MILLPVNIGMLERLDRQTDKHTTQEEKNEQVSRRKKVYERP